MNLQRGIRLSATLWMAFLGILFFVVYGSCNWVTSLRTDVGEFYFSWEKWIPFVPLMIVPYMSLDLFYAGSTFLCRDKSELHTLVARIVFALCLSAIGFLLFPLRFGFPRPETSGYLGGIFQSLYAFDQPFNLAPSLHISLRTILWPIYARRTKGVVRAALAVWFVLMGVSTLLVYQHHVVDVIGGHIVALICFYLFPEKSGPGVPARNTKVGVAYATGALVFGLGAILSNVLFIWPAVALSIVSAAYFGLGACVFRKREGGIPLSAKLLLAPYFLGAHLSFCHFMRRNVASSQITERLIIGRRLSAPEVAQLKKSGVTAVLDLTAEFSEATPLLDLRYRNIQWLDLTAPNDQQLEETVRFVQHHTQTGKVYVHCALGLSRSAAVAAAYLLAEGIATDEDAAIEMVRKVRPRIVIREEVRTALRRFRANIIEPTAPFGSKCVCAL